MKAATDFAIAQHDLQLARPGELLGARQSGTAMLRLQTSPQMRVCWFLQGRVPPTSYCRIFLKKRKPTCAAGWQNKMTF